MKKLVVALFSGLVLALSSVAIAQDVPGVTQIILFDYDGDEAELVKNFKNRQAQYEVFNPEARMRLLYDELHGEAIGRYRIHVDFPSLGYFAEAQGREKTAGWSAQNPDKKSVRVYDGLSRNLITPVNPPGPRGDDVKGPGLVQVVLFRYDGDEASLVANISKSQALYAKINPDASMRVLKDELHGAAANRYRMHIYYPSLSYFAAAQGREKSSEEWQALAAGRGGTTNRTYEGLSRVVVPAIR